MNKIIMGICLGLLTSLSFATSSATDLNQAQWTCSTNASSASTDTDKAADNKMSQNKTSASNAFSFAAQNCRDCTKITCEASQ
ncbi:MULTISPECIES: hypothetical protein [Legionella]|uniref:Lipoprotein n=1 Tax=Legionella drozanskii LLAP-1 TaxID=1212489 RepID=A0A0W0SQ67_9GAMM|nr:MULTISPECIES: hypothetical protein [Legionella]KTC85528.1 hypothetical protein Ldro_1853 [Legionella drozanskii LLAP-1]PJE15614.1 MAG: hypothetical protein CK430_04225 [Legionella sp.]